MLEYSTELAEQGKVEIRCPVTPALGQKGSIRWSKRKVPYSTGGALRSSCHLNEHTSQECLLYKVSRAVLDLIIMSVFCECEMLVTQSPPFGEASTPTCIAAGTNTQLRDKAMENQSKELSTSPSTAEAVECSGVSPVPENGDVALRTCIFSFLPEFLVPL